MMQVLRIRTVLVPTLCLFTAAARGEAARGPNIVIVCADQMRASAMGCMGSDLVRTPHLDRLAAQGNLFTNAIAATPQCTAYRASLLTGRYGHSTGIVHNDLKLPHEEITFAEILKEHGYATGFIGKWHLNAGRGQAKGTDEKAGFVAPGPDRQGFDYWAALECSHNYYHTRYFNDTPEPIPVEAYEPDVQTDLAIQFLAERKDRPFCLVMMWGPPHSPYKPPPKWDIYDPAQVPVPPNVPEALRDRARTELAQYYGLVSSLDDNMGRLSEALDQLGLAEETIVIFTSDHGDMLRSHGYTRKGRPQSESLHIPFIFRYPAAVKAGQVREMPICSVDVMPTLLGFCGIDVPENVQGRDLSDVMASAGRNEPDVAFAEANLTGVGNSPGAHWRALRSRQYTYAISVDGPWLLFDNRSDPFQLDNLVDKPEYQQIVAEFDRTMDEWRTRLQDTAALEGTLQTGTPPSRVKSSRRQAPKSREALAKSIVQSRDKDGDGKLTCREFNRGFTGDAAQEKLERFTQADTNNDQFMTVEEFTIFLQTLSQKKGKRTDED